MLYQLMKQHYKRIYLPSKYFKALDAVSLMLQGLIFHLDR